MLSCWHVVAALGAALSDAHPKVRKHAAWAIGKLMPTLPAHCNPGQLDREVDDLERDANVPAHSDAGQSISNSNIAPLFVKMAQHLDLRCVLVPPPWVLGPKHVSNPE